MLKIKPYDPEELRKCKFVENRYVCSICYDIFSSIELLKIHYIDIHSYKQEVTSDRDFFSESSDQSSTSVITTVVEEEKPKQNYFSSQICEICGKKLTKNPIKIINFKYFKDKNSRIKKRSLNM